MSELAKIPFVRNHEISSALKILEKISVFVTFIRNHKISSVLPFKLRFIIYYPNELGMLTVSSQG